MDVQQKVEARDGVYMINVSTVNALKNKSHQNKQKQNRVAAFSSHFTFI